ncbi:MAG: hypothetical protein IJ257_06720 [Treponema sp.]|nr:hypothetical protein [Treponema sp.]
MERTAQAWSEMNYHITNILEMLEDESGKYSEERESDVRNLIDSFSCQLNAEIEYFLHHNAIEFAKRKQCITYFIRDFNGELVAYYTSDTNRFREFGTRESKSENITYRQFLRLF